MRGRYYIVNGLMPYSKETEKMLDKLVPKHFTGNVVNELTDKFGYRLDESEMALYAPDGRRVCTFINAM